MTTDQLHKAANAFFAAPYQIDLIGSSSGYSNSRLARVTDSRGQRWCLRQWVDTTEDQIRFIHDVLIQSRAHGFGGLPRLAHAKTGESLLLFDDGWFDAQEWIAGGPAYGLGMQNTHQRMPNTAWHFTAEKRRAVTIALAAFHASTETLESRLRQQHISAHVMSMLPQMPTQQQLTLEAHHITDNPANKMLLSQWLELLPRLTTYLHGQVTANTLVQGASVICHGDLWSDHVYFVEGRFSGFTDFGALTVTSPAVDLAQLILHFGGWQTREEVLAMYTNDCVLSAQDEGMLSIVAVSDLVSEGYWALSQLSSDKLSTCEASAHWHNLHILLPSLQVLAEEL